MSKKPLPLEATASSTSATESLLQTEDASHTPIFKGNTVVAGWPAYSTPVYTPPNIIWSPKEDITPYELALCLPKLMCAYVGTPPFSKDELDGLKEGVGPFRHFQLV